MTSAEAMGALFFSSSAPTPDSDPKCSPPSDAWQKGPVLGESGWRDFSPMVKNERERNGQTCPGQSDTWDLGADKGPRDRKGVAFCFVVAACCSFGVEAARGVSGLRIFQLEVFSVKSIPRLRGDLNMNLFGCRQTSKGYENKMFRGTVG